MKKGPLLFSFDLKFFQFLLVIVEYSGYLLASNYTFNWSLSLGSSQCGDGKLILSDARCAASLFT